MYTMAFWSAYINFIDWKVIGLPGIRPFSIASMIGEQPLTLTLTQSLIEMLAFLF